MRLEHQISVGFEGASTTIFLRKEGKKLYLINYEPNGGKIHRSYGDMIPVGSYRIDLPHFIGATFQPLNEVWEISVPFAPHRELTVEEKRRCPVVLRHRWENAVVFEPLDLRKLESRLSVFLSGKNDKVVLENESYTCSRNLFVKEEGEWAKTSTNLQLVDELGSWAIYSPWCFLRPIKGSEFRLSREEEDSILRKVFGLFHDGANPEDPRTFFIGWCGENRVALKYYLKDPLKFPYSQPDAFRHNGWHLLPKDEVGDGIAIAYTCSKGKYVHIAAWRLCTTSSTFQPEAIVRDVYSNDFWLYRVQLLSEFRKELIGEKS